MDQHQMVKQMIQMNKLAFDNSYNTMTGTYEQNRLMLTAFLSQADTVPPEAKKAIENWLKSYKQGCEELKKMVDQGYQAVEQHLSEDPK
jgi:predicted outer membrane protein